MAVCRICPWDCQVDRVKKLGFCRLPNQIMVSHYQAHFWEEPMISGQKGSGTIFFTGCNSRCVFCQNYEISNYPADFGAKKPQIVTNKDLLTVCQELIKEHQVHNINLVSPTPYSELVRQFLIEHKAQITVPFVWNSNGYERIETIHTLAGLIDIYLPDFKYYSDELAVKYSRLPHYFQHASQAIAAMIKQVGFPQLNSAGIMQQGVIIRHLVLPGQIPDSKKVLQYIYDSFGPKAYVALMAQYYPTHQAGQYPEINRRLTLDEYDEITDYFYNLGFEDGLTQDLSSADKGYTPLFTSE